ncbi:MAG: isoprenylcysteine carboxylmethyltransferase family protein [Phycisphaerales bacterium]|nr:MAG: isoprenylcysteine carboxylmethyltransferase family protein [Phycisphaerales bacterium]
MGSAGLIIVIHQVFFQGMFFTKNISLRRRLGVPIRGKNREAVLSAGFIGLFILLSIAFGFMDEPIATVPVLPGSASLAIALALLVVSVLLGAASLVGLRDSWRVGVPEDQHTELVEEGIYRFSRNPYFVSYLIMFAGYTLLLQNVILLILWPIGFALVHSMVLKEEKHLAALHGERYLRYKKRVPRYIFV